MLVGASVTRTQLTLLRDLSAWWHIGGVLLATCSGLSAWTRCLQQLLMIAIDLAGIEGQLLALSVGLAVGHVTYIATRITWHRLLVIVRIQRGSWWLSCIVTYALMRGTLVAALRWRRSRAMTRVLHLLTIWQRDNCIRLRVAEMRLLMWLLQLRLIKVGLACGGCCQSLWLPVVAGNWLCSRSRSWSRNRKRGLWLTVVADRRDNWLLQLLLLLLWVWLLQLLLLLLWVLLLLVVDVGVDQQRIKQHRSMQLLRMMCLMLWQVLLLWPVLLLLWHVVALMRRVHHGRLVRLQLVGASMWAQGLHNESGWRRHLLRLRLGLVEWNLRARIMILLRLAAAEQQCQLNVCDVYTINQSIMRSLCGPLAGKVGTYCGNEQQHDGEDRTKQRLSWAIWLLCYFVVVHALPAGSRLRLPAKMMTLGLGRAAKKRRRLARKLVLLVFGFCVSARLDLL